MWMVNTKTSTHEFYKHEENAFQISLFLFEIRSKKFIHKHRVAITDNFLALFLCPLVDHKLTFCFVPWAYSWLADEEEEELVLKD